MSTYAKYLRVNELAAEWRQHPATIYRKIESGEIPAVRLGGPHAHIRIPVDELEARLHEQERGRSHAVR
jgi:excisionase family DNA binding protein